MRLVVVETRSGRPVRRLLAEQPATLRWLAQHDALEIHCWSSRAGAIEEPDWMVFDLDPAERRGLEQAVRVGRGLHGLLERLKLPSVVETSGRDGLHVYVPLAPGHSHAQAIAFATRVGEAVTRLVPEATMERALGRRRGRLYFDCFQNGRGKTLVAPDSLRAVDGAPVSAPLRWSEVADSLDPRRFNLRTMPGRLARVGDLFARVFRGGVRLPEHP